MLRIINHPVQTKQAQAACGRYYPRGGGKQALDLLPAGEFKQKCLALTDKVAATGAPIIEATFLAPSSEIARWSSDAAA